MDWYALCYDGEPMRVRQFSFQPSLFDFSVGFSSHDVGHFTIRRCRIVLDY